MSEYRPLPIDPIGYAVDPGTRIIHTRYAPHAAGLPRTRLASGVWAIVGHDPIPCTDCYGPEVPVRSLSADDLELMPAEPEPPRRRRRVHEEPDEVAGS